MLLFNGRIYKSFLRGALNTNDQICPSRVCSSLRMRPLYDNCRRARLFIIHASSFCEFTFTTHRFGTVIAYCRINDPVTGVWASLVCTNPANFPFKREFKPVGHSDAIEKTSYTLIFHSDEYCTKRFVAIESRIISYGRFSFVIKLENVCT